VDELKISEFTQISNQGEKMGATEMTATGTNRLVRYGALLAGLLAAIMMTFAVQAKDASAADAVGNPGTFTVTWNSAGFRWAPNHLNESKFNLSGASYQINVAADGTITPATYPTFGTVEIYGDCLTGAFLCIGAPKGVKSTPEVHPNGWSGSINPKTGLLNLNLPMRVRMQSVSGSSINDCYVGSNASPIAIQPSTTKSGGVAYNFNTGTATATDAGFYSPTPGGAGGGGGSSNCDRTNSYPNVGLPSTDTHANLTLTIKNGAGDPVKPWPVRPSFTVSPDPVGVTQTATFNASASVVENGVQACASEDVSQPNCGYRWDFDGDGTIDKVTNGPTTTYVYTSSGNKTPKLTIFDTQGKSDIVTGTVWAQDLPIAQVDSGAPAVSKEIQHNFTFSIPANPYGATTQCSIDNGAWNACTSGNAFNFTQANDTIGNHSFRVRGVTPGGVVGPSAEYTFTIDRVKPRVTIDTHPVNPTNITSASFTFTADKPNTTLECQLDGGAWVPCGTGSTGSRSYSGLTETSPTPTEAPNPHEFRVRATDQYGNVGGDGNPGGGAYDWDVDLTSPLASFSTKPANPSSDVSPVFVFDSNEAIQLAQCRLAINGAQGAWQNCGSLTTKSFSNLADGTYALGLRTIDLAGNLSDAITYQWNLETVTPPISFTGTPPQFSNRTSAQFLFDTEDGATTRCQLDGGPVQDPCPSGVKYSYLAAGTHIFSVTSTDPALNETTITYTWDIKTVKPAVQIEAASLPDSSSTSADANFEMTTANGDAECRLDGGSWSPCDSNAGQAYTGLADGTHNFEVRAVDEYSNVSATDAYTWLVVANPPEVSFGQTPDATTNKSTGIFTFAVATADDNATTVCSLDGTTAVACGSPAAVTELADGSHTFEVTATDTAGQTHTASYDWNVKAKIPGLGFGSAPDAISNSTNATFEFSSDEDPDVTYECRLDSGSFDACASPVNLSELGQGDHSFTVRATDPVGNRATEAYLWKVDSVAPAVTLSQTPPATTADVAELIKFSASESSATFACKLDNGNFAACTSPALVKNLATGSHTFTVKATDDAGNTGDEVSATWVIQAPAVSNVAGDQTSSSGAQSQAAKSAAATTTVKKAVSKSSAAKGSKKAKKARAKKRAKRAKARHAKRAKANKQRNHR
jgi:hypothetical protein